MSYSHIEASHNIYYTGVVCEQYSIIVLSILSNYQRCFVEDSTMCLATNEPYLILLFHWQMLSIAVITITWFNTPKILLLQWNLVTMNYMCVTSAQYIQMVTVVVE